MTKCPEHGHPVFDQCYVCGATPMWIEDFKICGAAGVDNLKLKERRKHIPVCNTDLENYKCKGMTDWMVCDIECVGEGVVDNPEELPGLTAEDIKEHLRHIGVDFATDEDMVHNPKHYKLGIPGYEELEVIDVIRAILGPDGFKAYCHGAMIKYVLRKKFDMDEDIAKAGKYSEFYGEEDV